jgi:hypothetical protein
MMTTLLLLASLAGAQLTDPSPTGVKRLHDDFTEVTDEKPRAAILAQLARTRPETPADVDALYDLFMRFTDDRVRSAALRSLSLMNPSSPYLEPVFERYLSQPEAESKLFALKGILRLRDENALSEVRKIALRKFALKNVDDTTLVGERNNWWVQYEALSVLAQWKPEEALPLLAKKSSEAPGVARLIGAHLWKEAFPQIVAWSKSSSIDDRDRARRALEAPAPSAALRATRDEMLKAVRDPKAPRGLRHQFALKLGVSSTPAELPPLIQEHDAAADPDTKLMLAALLFASRDKQVAPVLIAYLKENPDPNIRAGALVQLRDMVDAKEFAALAAWAEKNDPDEANRKAAAAVRPLK